jgi:hypothetical protein
MVSMDRLAVNGSKLSFSCVGNRARRCGLPPNGPNVSWRGTRNPIFIVAERCPATFE